MRVPINLTGGFDENRSRPLSSQRTINWWPQFQATKKNRSEYILRPYYGLKLFVEHSGDADRGMCINQGVLYKITDQTLYTVDSIGTHVSLGTIPGSGRCMMKALGGQLVIANGSGLVYIWDGSTLTQNTDANLGTPRGVAVLNSQAIYDDGEGQGWVVSDVGEPGTIDGLNYASAESYSDDLLIPAAWRETLYLMGTDTIEIWWNSGEGNPPFDKVQGAIVNMGLDAIHSVAETPDYLFFLGADKQFHSLSPGTSTVDTPISNQNMADKISEYLVTSDCIGWTMEFQGQWFYVATFPSEDVTWVYPIGGEWFEWGTGHGRIRANSYAKAFNRHLVAEHNSGNIYELDSRTYTDVGEPIIRTRITAPIHSGMIGPSAKPFEINGFELVLETGVGLLAGQGIDPKIMLSVSRDGGKSFGTERMLKTGRLGKQVTVTTGPFGRFSTDCVIRLRASDPIAWTIYSAAIEMEICI